MLIRDMMHKKVISVSKTTNVREICKLLAKNKISGVPVVEKGGKLVGFVSERDIIAAVPKADFVDRTAQKVMTKRVKTITAEEPLAHASKIFATETYRHLPVTKAGKVVGIVTRKDITTQMMKHYY